MEKIDEIQEKLITIQNGQADIKDAIIDEIIEEIDNDVEDSLEGEFWIIPTLLRPPPPPFLPLLHRD